MATREEIEINFENAMHQAEELDDIAGQLESTVNQKYDGTLQSIMANWKGDNARQYIAKGEALKTEMQNTAKDIRNTAATIRQIAINIKNAEMAALELAEQRIY